MTQIPGGGHGIAETQDLELLSGLFNRNVQHDLLLTRNPFHCPFGTSIETVEYTVQRCLAEADAPPVGSGKFSQQIGMA
jgi:hypothetical protein